MATLSPVVKHEASTISSSWSSSVDVPSKVAGNASPGVKEGEVTPDSVILTRKGFKTVRFLSHRRTRFFRMPRDRSSTSSFKENSGLFLLKLFSALLSLMNDPSWPRKMTPKGPGSSSLYKLPGSLYVSHFIPVPLRASHKASDQDGRDSQHTPIVPGSIGYWGHGQGQDRRGSSRSLIVGR
jgi:hypothetical protein